MDRGDSLDGRVLYGTEIYGYKVAEMMIDELPFEAIENLIAVGLSVLAVIFMFNFIAGDVVRDMAKPPMQILSINKRMGYPSWLVYRWWWKKTTFSSCLGGCAYLLFLPVLAVILIIVNVAFLDCQFAMPICR